MTFAPILVLIVNYRTAELTVQAILAVAREIRERGDAHILVVDNGSDDGSAHQIAQAIADKELSDIVSMLALDINHGFAGGNNAGLIHYRNSTGSWPAYAWLLNPDTIAEPDALGALVDAMEQRPAAGMAGGRCFRPDGTIRHSAFRFHSPLNQFLAVLDFGPLRALFWKQDVVMPLRDVPHRAEWLSGSHLLIRGTVFEQIGLLDPAYFLYFEETDFCARAAAAGFEAWHVPASHIVHIGGQATGLTEYRPSRRPRYWFASRARFLLRRHGLARTHLANLLWLIGAPFGMVIAKARRRTLPATPRLWLDFLLHYYGLGGLMYRPHRLAR